MKMNDGKNGGGITVKMEAKRCWNGGENVVNSGKYMLIRNE